MIIKPTLLRDCYVIQPTLFEDERGYFYEKYNAKKFEQYTGLKGCFVQENVSKSAYGVLRGLHLQKGQKAQAKMVSCLEGKVFDVAVDLREKSETFGKWFGIELSAENRFQLYIPRGFAHGFSVLSSSALFCYKCDNFYDKNSEGGIIYNDPDLSIDWKLNESEIILSERDRSWSLLREGEFR